MRNTGAGFVELRTTACFLIFVTRKNLTPKTPLVCSLEAMPKRVHKYKLSLAMPLPPGLVRLRHYPLDHGELVFAINGNW